MMSEKRIELHTRPSESPMRLDDGKPTPREALLTTAVNLAFLLVAAIGAWIVYLFVPKNDYEAMPAWAMIGAFFGFLVTIFCLIQAYIYGNITRRGWSFYYRRLDEWHRATLDFYYQMNGQETTTTISQYDYSPDMPHHVLVTALAIHRQITQGGYTGKKLPYSVRALEGPLMLSAGRHAIRVGELHGTVPEKMSNRLAQLGLIAGRRSNVAGQWIPADESEVIELVTRNWHKVSGRSVYTESDTEDEY